MKDLELYNQKRNFKKTSEPLGKKSKEKGHKRFCVQHHLARKDHFDFRLELNGVLKSWAVPKGPSYNTKDKRLAVMVEDHPLSYRNFEGVIPKGEYGGGVVQLWDEGVWESIGDALEGLKNGMLKFYLKGKRLHGMWMLVRFKNENWLLVKENDNVLGYVDIREYKTSVKTGRTVDEIKEKLSKKDMSLIVQSIQITSPTKIIFEKEKITKMEIVKYYEKVAERMMPFLESRIVSVKRCPNGMKNGTFYMKHLEDKHLGIGKKRIGSDSKKQEDYYYIQDVAGLIFEVQMNSYEFHLWGSRVDHLNYPDMMVFDLDPDENLSLKKVRDGVRDLKSILDELGLKSFLKTSGGKGYHIVVPFKTMKSWKKFRQIAEDVVKVMEKRWPNKYVSNMRLNSRKGKIFVDYFRNTKGATSVAPYSLRLKEKCRVSMPIFWNELDKVKPDGITMEEAIKRLKRKNPWEDFFIIDQ